MNKLRQHVKKSARLAIVKQVREQLESMIDQAQTLAKQQGAPLISEAKQQIEQANDEEIGRLLELQKLNDTVRDEEIDYFRRQKDEALARLSEASAELQAIRIIINT